jgi:MFS family permease
MRDKRWLRIIPLALIMYTIAYVDRTNISLSLDPTISNMMKDLVMDDKMKGEAAGIFFYGYVLLQIPGGILASRWSARKTISICLVSWGVFAAGCGLAQTFHQFEVMRFMLGLSESAIFPATTVLLTQWFPRTERARANSLWLLCQPLALVASAPITGKLLDLYGWRTMLFLEGSLPFVWLPIWWFFIRDHPSEAKWISAEERNALEQTLREETVDQEPALPISMLTRLFNPVIIAMIVLYFLHNSAAYGCMTFFTDSLKGRNFTGMEKGVLLALPYALTAVLMVLNSWHSDKTGERRGHVAAAYLMSGTSLILSVSTRDNFWLSYAFLCFAIPGPFVAMCPFWTIPAETLPRNLVGLVVGLVNAFGSFGGIAGPLLVGWLEKKYNSTALGFNLLGAGMLINVALTYMLPKSKPRAPTAPITPDLVDVI